MEPLQSETASEDSMLSLFECPVCSDSVLPPIVQCRNGHLVCATCRENLDTCPVCREELGNEMMLCAEADSADAISYWMQLQLCFGREFLVVLRRRPIDDERWRYCAVVQMIDPDDNAANGYAYHLEFHGRDGPHAREGMPLGVEDNVTVAFDNSDCLEFDISNDQIKLFGGVVRIKSTVEDIS
ncbi:hypothetical protein MTO96_010231 [Rhipicephalus appendiculatus]